MSCYDVDRFMSEVTCVIETINGLVDLARVNKATIARLEIDYQTVRERNDVLIALAAKIKEATNDPV